MIFSRLAVLASAACSVISVDVSPSSEDQNVRSREHAPYFGDGGYTSCYLVPDEDGTLGKQSCSYSPHHPRYGYGHDPYGPYYGRGGRASGRHLYDYEDYADYEDHDRGEGSHGRRPFYDRDPRHRGEPASKSQSEPESDTPLKKQRVEETERGAPGYDYYPYYGGYAGYPYSRPSYPRYASSYGGHDGRRVRRRGYGAYGSGNYGYHYS